MTTIEEDFVSFETAKLLKEKGFDARCPMIYTADGELLYTDVKHHNMYAVTNKQLKYYTDIIAPSQAMAMKWLRKVHHIFIQIELYSRYEDYNFKIFQNTHLLLVEARTVYSTYSETVEIAIKYTLEHLI